MEKDQQELIFKLSMFEQQIQQLQQQLEAVEQAIVEAGSLNLGLEELKGSKDKEVMTSIGKGIFIPAKISSEELIVDVGGKNFVQKSIQETQSLIEGQVKKLEDIKLELETHLERVGEELTRVYSEAQEKSEK